MTDNGTMDSSMDQEYGQVHAEIPISVNGNVVKLRGTGFMFG